MTDSEDVAKMLKELYDEIRNQRSESGGGGIPQVVRSFTESSNDQESVAVSDGSAVSDASADDETIAVANPQSSLMRLNTGRVNRDYLG